MKKIIFLLTAMLLVSSGVSLSALAENADSVKVYVTISDDSGKLVLIQEPVTVTDIDEDGAITLNDALYLAHEAAYNGGADAGYAASKTEFGISLDKLWGIANGGSYGYYINNQSTLGLADAVKDGDYVNAYVYTDLTDWSDTYSYFDRNTLEAESGSEIELKLTHTTFDEEFNLKTEPVEGAVITVNGTKTDAVTDKDGKVTVVLENSGKNIISAVSDTLTLIPPVSIIQVSDESQETDSATTSSDTPVTGDSFNGIFALLSTSFLGAFLLRKKHEK